MKDGSSDGFPIGLDIKFRHGLLMEFMRKHNLNLKQFGREAGISETTMHHIISMKHAPRQEVTKKLADYTGISPEKLFPGYYRAFIKTDKGKTPRRVQLTSTASIKAFKQHGEWLEPKALQSPEHTVLWREYSDKIKESFDILTPRQEEILKLRFGIGKDKVYTLDEIALRLDLTRERIRQIEINALDKLRNKLGDDLKLNLLSDDYSV